AVPRAREQTRAGAAGGEHGPRRRVEDLVRGVVVAAAEAEVLERRRRERGDELERAPGQEPGAERVDAAAVDREHAVRHRRRAAPGPREAAERRRQRRALEPGLKLRRQDDLAVVDPGDRGAAERSAG